MGCRHCEPLGNKDPVQEEILAFTRFRKGIPQRLHFDDYPKQQTRNFRVPVMKIDKIILWARDVNRRSQVSGGLGKYIRKLFWLECLSTAEQTYM